MIRLNNQGETIVAVLISVAVVSLVLVSSYVIVRRSFNLGIAARERTQALKVIESQLERLKYMVVASDPDQNPFNPPTTDPSPNSFCISDDLELVDLTAMGADLTNCELDDLVTGAEREFEFSIHYDADGPNDAGSTYDDDLFILKAEWVRVGTDEIDQITIYYRIHQPPTTLLDSNTAPVQVTRRQVGQLV